MAIYTYLHICLYSFMCGIVFFFFFFSFGLKIHSVLLLGVSVGGESPRSLI